MKDPAFLFYPNDFLGGTLGMSREEKGAYIDLMLLQFNRGHMTKDMIGQMFGHDTERLWNVLRSKFKEDENGCFFNDRLEQEQNKRKAYSESRRKNVKGINQHTKSADKKGGHMTSHMENENRDRDIIDNSNNIIILNTEKKEEKIIVPFAEIVEAYNSICISLPKCSKLTEDRKKKIKQRWSEMENDMGKITELFTKTQQSDFCTGKVKEWTANFDWLFENSKNWVKVVEGNYDNKILPTKAADHDRYHSDFASDLEERWLGKKSGMA